MDTKKIKTSCLINNYNYAAFLSEAVASALQQTVKFDEIIIVDDASTDNSAEVIAKFAQQADIKYILKDKNQGQLSSFNEAFLNASGDIIFFLDADDAYEPEYLETALNFYDRRSECDFVFCAYKKFGAVEGIFQDYQIDVDLGYSVIRTLCNGEWIGSITSTLSMRRNILRKVLPIPNTEDWRVRADDCLVWGASLVGAKKFYLSQPLVRYRIHQNNQFHNSKFVNTDKDYEYKRFWKRNSLFNYILQKNNLELPLLLAFTSLNELKTIPCPNTQDFISYLKIIFLFEKNLYWKIKGILLLFNYLVKVLLSGKLQLR
ncbi:Glycosyl transferase, family 2 [Trichormus variabilis ATCC 29413]|uniref:Glycosyl transferase, family 2 n=3 Tax=Anabaena variabilis TaxID=264691 RepID=Q3MDC7_TRIV2|nr:MULTISPECIES: glycosyltransferase family 2 protein [Nostocaceae]ABA21009.1 Glycosyl transferase, family 2 [Trichormus variabilis ATCC 29413]MBC1214157.1 glycosyltransferase family 2 protein [Trichormus variabilis ARAD]MBC1300670.1 glycosyltransferase family 2 protein [Trichormus variabilis N2B]MBC1310496.1 glycosyltransferase family 2 protein [Trichormus variabilis PNB]MBC1325884.1 glycosyltransferase family 2 protein [Trichormus variabilis 9RC]